MKLHDLSKAAELANRLKVVREQVDKLSAAISADNISLFKIVAKEKISIGGTKVPNVVITLQDEALINKLNAATLDALSDYEGDLTRHLEDIGIKVD